MGICLKYYETSGQECEVEAMMGIDGNTLANSNGLLVGNWHIPSLHGLETIGTSHDEPVHGK